MSNREVVSTAASCTEMLDQVLRAAESREEVVKSDITTEVVEQLKQVAPKLTGIIEAHGEGDAAMLEALFNVLEGAEKALRLYKKVADGVTSVPILPPSRYVYIYMYVHIPQSNGVGVSVCVSFFKILSCIPGVKSLLCHVPVLKNQLICAAKRQSVRLGSTPPSFR